MKARLTKLFTLLAILTLGITQLWAGVTIFSSVSQETTDGSWVITGSSNSASNQSNVVFPNPAVETGFPAGKVSANTAYYCKLSSSGDKGSKLSTTKRITIGGLSASDSIVVYWFATSTTTGKLCLSYATGASAGAYIEEVSLGTIVTKQLYATSFKALTATDIDHIENGYSGSAKLAYISSNGPSPYVYAVKIIAGSTTKHSVTYVLGDGTGTTPTQADVAEGAKFTLHDGVTGITAPANKDFDGWHDGTTKYAGGAEYTMGTSNVILTAQWKNHVANYTVIYKDGTTELGSETVEVGHHPTGSEIAAPTKDCYTYAGWDPALNTVSGSDGDEVVVNATWTPLYASSFNFGTTTDLTKDNIATKLATSNIFCSVGTGGSYDAGGTTGYLGYKFKNNGDYVTFIVQDGYEAIVTYGYTESGWQVNGADAGVTVKTQAYVDKKYQAEGSDLLLKLVNQSANSKTSVLTNIVIKATATGEDDATLSDLSVSGYTLNPSFDSATEDYTITKEYGAADPVVGDVTATPSVTGADADIAWDGTNHKFVITVTAKDGVTKKTYNITINEAEARKSLSRVLFSNGFDAFIDNTNHTVKAFYLAGTAAPTATTITAGAGTAGTLSEGKIRVTGADDSYVDYIVTLEAVTPNTTTVAEEAAAGEFAGDEAWVKNGLLISGTAAGFNADGKYYVNRRLLKSGDAADDQRVIAGWVRSYFFVGNAYKFIMTASNNIAIKYSIDGGEQVASNAATVEITLPAGNHMIEIVSNQSNGDCRLSAPKLVERPATYSVTYKAGEGTGDDVIDAFEYAAGDEVTVQANAFTAPASKKFNGWASAPAVTISEGKFEMPASNVVLTAQWKEYFTITYKDGETILGTEDVFTDATPVGIADPSKAGYDFAGWVDGEDNPVTIASLSATTTVYAKWTADPCPDKKSIVKAVMATNTTATVTGYNSNEYAGGYIVNNLADDASNTNMYDFGEGEVKGFKLKGSNSAIFATLSKGGFEVGDQVVFAVTKNAGDNKLAIYAAKDKDHVLKLVELDVDVAGIYTYRLTQDNIDAIEAAGSDYLSIGTFRGDHNPYIYSVELKGCRSWAIFHTLTFKNFDGTATIAAEPLEEGAYASTVAPTAPKITLKRFLGWAEAVDGTPVDLTSYTITEDKTLYAVYEDIVCPTTGTVYKFEIKDELSSENLPTSTDKDMSSYITATGDGYLTYTATANNKATINSDGTIQLKDATAAYLKVELECALAAGDQIRAHVTNNPIRVQVAATYDSGKDLILAKDDYTFVDITSAMEGKQVLYITRSTNGNSNIADFEIYRRPVVTGVTLSDLTVREGASTIPTMTLSPSDDARVTSQAWSILSGEDKITINATTGEVTGVAQGDAEIKVVLNGDPAISATATVHVVQSFSQQDVDEPIVWDFSKAGVVSSAFSEQVLANVDGVTLDASQFEATKLVGTAQNISATYFQGTMLTFNTTKAGLISVRFTNGNSNVRTLKVYVGDPEVEIASWSYSNAAVEHKFIEVPAGKVTLRSYQESNPNNVRILNLEFYALGHSRDVTPGNLGTLCLPNACIARGVDVYELVGKEATYGKIVFADLEPDDLLVAGKPYIFQVNEATARFYYAPGEPVDAPLNNGSALKGNLGSTITFQPNSSEAENVYFVKDHALWSAKETGVKIGQYRAYLQMDEVGSSSPSPAPGRRYIMLGTNGTNVATGIDDVQDDVRSTKMLIDGRLFILRGEKIYDATGRLVK